MKVRSFQQQGRRPYQEDTYFASTEQGLYIVCDGVGGAAKGEVASLFITENIVDLIQNQGLHPVDPASAQALISALQQRFLARVREHPEEEGMGTTLTFLYQHARGITVAHIGDSRVYFVRPDAGCYWRTRDDSWVQYLFDKGDLASEDEMATHPMKNRITKAFQAIPDAEPLQASVSFFDDIKTGDLFLLCSDGVLEPFTPTDFIALLGEKSPLDAKFEAIRNACAAESSDNNTCILLEVQAQDSHEGHNPGIEMREIPRIQAFEPDHHPETPQAAVEPPPQPPPIQVAQRAPAAALPDYGPRPVPAPQRKKGLWKGALAGVLLLVMVGLAWTWLSPASETGSESTQTRDTAVQHNPVLSDHRTETHPQPAPSTPSSNSNTAPTAPIGQNPPVTQQKPDTIQHSNGGISSGDITLLPAAFDSVGKYSEGMRPVRINGKWGYADGKNKLLIDAKFLEAQAFSDGLAAVRNSSGWFYIGKNGIPAFIPNQIFEKAGPFVKGVAEVTKNKETFRIDKKGKRVE